LDLKEQESKQSASAKLSDTKAKSLLETGQEYRTSETSSLSQIVSFPSRYSRQPTKFNDVADTLTISAGPPAVASGSMPTSSPEDSHAKISASQDHAEDLAESDPSLPSPTLTLWSFTDLPGWCWKTSQAYSIRLADVTSPGSLVKWKNSGMVWRGACWTRNTSESPKGAVVSSLWQVLDQTVPAKYFLSAKAAAGILRRTLKRKHGQKLPPMLTDVLSQISTQANQDGVSGPRTPQGGTSSWARRMTPVECERLMGWPDGWTVSPQWRGKRRSTGRK